MLTERTQCDFCGVIELPEKTWHFRIDDARGWLYADGDLCIPCKSAYLKAIARVRRERRRSK